MTSDQIEEQAVKFLRTVSSSSSINVTKPPIPIELLAEDFLGLRIVPKFIHSDLSGIVHLIKKQIIINQREPKIRQRFTIAHEVGHWILHLKQNNFTFQLRKDKNRLDTEADIFAAALLMPRKLVYQYLLNYLNRTYDFDSEWLLDLLGIYDVKPYSFNRLIFASIFQSKDDIQRKKTLANILNSAIPELAEEFKVSKEAFSIRLKTMGLLNPIFLNTQK